MRIIVFGLGVFGGALAEELTRLGHDVIGVDANNHHVEEHKEKVTDCVCMISTEAHSLKTLPLREADLCVVAMGADFSQSIQTIALLKQLEVKHIAARCTTPLHRRIIEAIGVDTIIYPELEVAETFANRIDSGLLQGLYLVDTNNRIFEINLPKFLIGRTVGEVDLEKNFKLKIITIKRTKSIRQLNAKPKEEFAVLEDWNAETLFENDDRLIVFGHTMSFKKLMKSF